MGNWKKLAIGALFSVFRSPSALANPPPTQATLANLSTQYYEGLDGAAFLGATNGVYTAAANKAAWTYYPYAGDPQGDGVVVAVAGGSADRPLVVVQVREHTRRLMMLNPTTRPAIIKEVDEPKEDPGSFLFASDKIGCGWSGASLFVTTNGGVTWTPNTAILPNGEEIKCVCWTSPNELIAGGGDGNLCRLSVTDGLPKTVWTLHLQGSIVGIRPFGRNLIVFADSLSLVDKANAKEVDNIPNLGPIDGFETAGNVVYAYTSDYLAVVGWNGHGFDSASEVPAAGIDAIFTKRNPALIMSYGKDGVAGCFELSGQRLIQHRIQISSVPGGTAAATQGNEASDEELGEAIQWSEKLDESTAERIFQEAENMTNLSPRQQVLWARDECKRLAESGQHLKKK